MVIVKNKNSKNWFNVKGHLIASNMKKPSIIIQLVEQNMLQSVHSWLFRQILNLTAEMNLQIFSQTKHLFTYQHALQQFMVISIIKNVNTFYFLLMPLAQK